LPVVWACPLADTARAEGSSEPSLIVHNGRVVTVDAGFTVAEALAVEGGRIIRVGRDSEILEMRGPSTRVVDLHGKSVLPGLIDSHSHATDACMTEFDHEVPQMETIADVLAHIRDRAKTLGAGKWVVLRQVFITRLKEQRYPTRAEMDEAAPRNPVLFATGPDASLNTLALKLSGIDRDFAPDGPGRVERDASGDPTGILRNLTRYVKVVAPEREPTDAERDKQLLALLRDYNSVGITSIIDRDADERGIGQYERLESSGTLPVRVGISRGVGSTGPIEDVVKEIRTVGGHRLSKRDSAMLWLVGIKTYLDGGMLTGSAYMREPWGVSRIYAIDDPQYRGVLFIPHERLVPMVRAAVESHLQFTAHSVGDGAVHALLDAYEEVNRETPIAATRPCITHSNFMSREAIEQAARLGVTVDIQPAWLYLDTRTLAAHFGEERLRYFQPLASLFASGVTAGGGSDHMQKVGSLRSINPYNPFLAMWVAITRKAKGYEGRLHPEQALSREQAIRFYTINNARLLFREKELGSLEAGKLADFIVLDRDLLTCPEDDIREARVVATYLGGKAIFERHAD
jgi:predicted amidohydrolase YtcJ